MRKVLFLFAILSFMSFSCKKTSESTTTTTGTAAVPAIYQKIYGASSITSDGSYITIKTTGAPDHKSPYYAVGNALYENFAGSTFGGVSFSKNPNSISALNYTFKIPVNPQVATNHAATPLGAIGVALNGVPF